MILISSLEPLNIYCFMTSTDECLLSCQRLDEFIQSLFLGKQN